MDLEEESMSEVGRTRFRWVGGVLIVLGLAVLMSHVYVLGVAEGKSPGMMPDDVRRVASIKRTSFMGIGGGVLIAGVGIVLLRRRTPPSQPDARR